MHFKALDLTGQRHGMLTAIRVGERTASGRIRWHCICDCGKSTLVQTGKFRSKKSCGCVPAGLKHGHCNNRKVSPEYKAWVALRYRCNTPTAEKYPRYGARGITVCDKWDDFLAFLADVGPRPGPGYSIDRINNDGNYEPGNCRWATRHQQQVNRDACLISDDMAIEIHRFMAMGFRGRGLATLYPGSLGTMYYSNKRGARLLREREALERSRQ